ncbi:MAG: O-antigen ligase family protein [Blastocatellia bacterium]
MFAATLEKIIAGGLLLTLVFAILAHGAVESWAIALIEIMIALLLGVWGLRAFAARELRLSAPAWTWPLIGLVILGVLQGITLTRDNGLFSLSRDAEATRLVTLPLALFVIAALLGADVLQKRRRVEWLLHALTIGGFVLSLFAIIQKLTWNGKVYWIRPVTSGATSVFGPFANHNHFAGLMEMLALLPVAMILAGAVRREARLLYGFMAVIMSVATVLSLSRGGMISLATALAFLLTISLRARLSATQGDAVLPARLAGVGAVGLVAAAILIGVLWIGAEPVLDRVTRGSLLESNTQTATAQSTTDAAPAANENFHSSRGWIWRDTITMIAAHPWLGVGLGAYQTAYPAYSRHDGSLIVDNAHNDYLHLLAETGVIGGALALWFLIAAVLAVARGLHSRDPLFLAVALGAGAGLAAMLTHSVFDFNLQSPANAMTFLLLAVLADRAALASERVPAGGAIREVISRKAEVSGQWPVISGR